MKKRKTKKKSKDTKYKVNHMIQPNPRFLNFVVGQELLKYYSRVHDNNENFVFST